jgi:hypothetical protein
VAVSNEQGAAQLALRVPLTLQMTLRRAGFL